MQKDLIVLFFLRSLDERNPEMKCRVRPHMALLMGLKDAPVASRRVFPSPPFSYIDSEWAHHFREYGDTLAAGQSIAIFVIFETR